MFRGAHLENLSIYLILHSVAFFGRTPIQNEKLFYTNTKLSSRFAQNLNIAVKTIFMLLEVNENFI